MVLEVQFAPLRIPLKRRLQTLAVISYTLLFTVAPILSTILFFVVLFSPAFFIAIAYFTWIVYDYYIRNTSSRGGGGRRWEAFRKAAIWKYFAEYFPVQLIKTVPLDPEKNFLFACHPHGILGCGAFANFGSDATKFSEVFPGIRPHLLTLKANFRWPIMRALCLWSGICDVSRESIEWLMTKQGSGNAAVIVVGGAEESLEARPGSYKLTIRERKGFVKMAIRTGACIVPVYSFGENDLFKQADNPAGSGLRHFQETFKKIFGFAPPLFYGRGIFNYTLGLLPFRKPINTVVGRPIEVERNPNPDQELIDKVHDRYLVELSDLFDENKLRFGVDAQTQLCFI